MESSSTASALLSIPTFEFMDIKEDGFGFLTIDGLPNYRIN